MEYDIRNNPALHRFETTIDGKTALIDYKLKPGVMTVLHTEVPKELEGQGIAGAMTKYALEYMAREKLALIPICPYMRSYLKRHPEYQYLVQEKADSGV
ncbi:acetyltransferase [Pontibacter sp. HJ8]